MKNFNRKTDSYFPNQFVFIGYLISLFGLYLLFRLNFLGLIAIPAGLFISFSFVGIEIDFKDNKFKEYLGIFNFKFGKWHTLPKVEYVTIFVDRTTQEMHVVSISSTQTNSDFKINLIITKAERISVGTFINKDLALETANQLADGLKTKLLDYTSGKPVWLK